MALVFIPAPLRRLTGGQSRLEVAASSVAELLDGLEARYPGMRNYLCDDHGLLRQYVNLFVNNTEVRQLGGLETRLGDSDEIRIIPAMAGGARLLTARRAER